MITFPEPLLPAEFVRRENRFRATLLLNGSPVAAHLANSGRLGELLVPGAPCYVSRATNPNRKTGYDLRLVTYDSTLVSVDARLPNPLFADALQQRALAEFIGYTQWRGEVRRGQSRLDFLLTGPMDERLWVEVKSVTLVENGVALFPDAPTIRGRKHLAELTSAVKAGERAAVVFVVQRPDARFFAPHLTADPAFAQALSQAAAAGVLVQAYTCRVSLSSIEIARAIPISLARLG